MLILPITDMYKNLIFLEKKKSIGKKELNLYIRFSLKIVFKIKNAEIKTIGENSIYS